MNQQELPIISVCIANYNGDQLLQDCIESVLDQRVDGRIEIIVHDDASTDNSLKLLRTRYPNISVIPSKDNVGFCKANNRMAQQAKGTFLLLLNNDAALLPDSLATLLATTKKPAITTLPQYDWESGDIVDRGCLLDPFFNPVPNLDYQRQDVAMVIGACLFVPAKVWKELGGLPEWMESIGEDLYFCGKARLRGYPVQVATSGGYRHRQGHSFGGNRVLQGRLTSTYRRRELSERNKTLALAIITPAPLVYIIMPLHLAALLAEGVGLSLLTLSTMPLLKIYFPAIFSLATRRSLIQSERGMVQSECSLTLLQYLSTTRWQLRKLRLLLQHGIPTLHTKPRAPSKASPLE